MGGRPPPHVLLPPSLRLPPPLVLVPLLPPKSSPPPLPARPSGWAGAKGGDAAGSSAGVVSRGTSTVHTWGGATRVGACKGQGGRQGRCTNEARRAVLSPAPPSLPRSLDPVPLPKRQPPAPRPPCLEAPGAEEAQQRRVGPAEGRGVEEQPGLHVDRVKVRVLAAAREEGGEARDWEAGSWAHTGCAPRPAPPLPTSQCTPDSPPVLTYTHAAAAVSPLSAPPKRLGSTSEASGGSSAGRA
jgi:hypothetical protein